MNAFFMPGKVLPVVKKNIAGIFMEGLESI